MIPIDLVTGFLGAGKTTFICKYASYLASKGHRVGIIENDFGAVNVDMLMLMDLPKEAVEVEQIVGGSVVADWKRRFRTKLISMAMRGFNRILVEPSGIYDVDAFFDVLWEDPINNWYCAGNIFMLMDSSTIPDEWRRGVVPTAPVRPAFTEAEEYLLVSQAANAGKIILSKTVAPKDNSPGLCSPAAQASCRDLPEACAEWINALLNQYRCNRTYAPEDIMAVPWDMLTEEHWLALLQSGWRSADHEKLWFDHREAFQSLFFMNLSLSREGLFRALEEIFRDPSCGTVYRIKGTFSTPDEPWIAVNAMSDSICLTPVTYGQEILIAIGRNLNEAQINSHLEAACRPSTDKKGISHEY